MSEYIEGLIPYAGLLGYTVPLVFSLGVTYSTLKNKDELYGEKIRKLSELYDELEDRVTDAEISIGAFLEALKNIQDSLKRIESALYKHIDKHHS